MQPQEIFPCISYKNNVILIPIRNCCGVLFCVFGTVFVSCSSGVFMFYPGNGHCVISVSFTCKIVSGYIKFILLEGLTISCVLPQIIYDVLPELWWIHVLETIFVLMLFLFVQCCSCVYHCILTPLTNKRVCFCCLYDLFCFMFHYKHQQIVSCCNY